MSESGSTGPEAGADLLAGRVGEEKPDGNTARDERFAHRGQSGNQPAGEGQQGDKPVLQGRSEENAPVADGHPANNAQVEKPIAGDRNGITAPNGNGKTPPMMDGSNGHATRLDELPDPSRIAPPEEAACKFCRDVLLPTSGPFGDAPTAVHQARDAAFSITNKPLKAVVAQISKLWNTGKDPIRYVFLPGSWIGNDIQHEKVRTCIKEWEKYASIHFEEVAPDSDWKTRYSRRIIRITFYDLPDGNEAGSWSVIGTDVDTVPVDRATMNFGWVKGNSSLITAEEKAVIWHEFGHSLGLLHEHASLAGGGVPLKNVREAIRYYHSYNGWDEATIMAQVVNTYNLQDVSSFSKVDRSSIMHYPVPASVSGLPYDIPYQYTLSDMDKAYMRVNYPANNPTDETQKLLQAALVTIGIVKSEPETANKIRDLAYKADSKGVVNPNPIRELFSAWCRRNIPVTVIAEGNDGSGTGSSIQTLQAPSSAVSSPPIIHITKGPMCAVKDNITKNSKSGSGVPKPSTPAKPTRLKAVNNPLILDFRWPLDELAVKPENKDYRATATYSFAPCPLFKAHPDKAIEASQYRKQLVADALYEWGLHASINFTAIEHPKDGDAKLDDLSHMTIVFQDYYYDTDKLIPLYEVGFESYAYPSTRAPAPPKADGLSDAEYKQEMKEYEFEVPIKHTICFRGIVTTKALGAEPATEVDQNLKDTIVTKEMVSRRTILHEIGHWLGLEHENVGAYGAFIFDDLGQSPDARDAALKALIEDYRFTLVDTGSVMDSLCGNDVLRIWEERKSPLVAFRTVREPSAIDIANIALIHPGKGLNAALIDKYAANLKYKPEIIAVLKDCLQKGNLNKLRTAHLDAQKATFGEWMGQLDKDVGTEIQKLLSKKLNAPRPFLRDGPDPSGTPSTPSNKFDAGLLGAVYNALQNAFGPQGAQFISLQFPTRFLAKEDFTFDLAGSFSNFVKPVTVAEAEARLVDAMYDPSPIVGGPNGKTLSTVYGQAINNLVPLYDPEDRPAREQRERMRAWLLTEVGDQNPFYKLEVNTATGGHVTGTGMSDAANKALLASNTVKMRKMTRMEFANQLTQDYLDAQTDWELEREKYIHKAISTRDQAELETVTRTLVHVTAARQNKLAMKYSDSVVRGYSHIVREALGQLDVSTTAEMLQDAKDSFRATALSSLYSASKVLPVLITPVDWAVGLDTNFTPEDLADSPELVIMMIQTKASQLDSYKAQMTLLQGAVDGDPATLKAAVESAARNLDKAESTLNGKYLDSTIELAKIVINLSTSGAAGAAVKAAEMTTDLEKTVKSLDPMGTVEDIGKQVTAVSDAQRALQQATSVYASKSAALARAEATDTRTQQANIQRSIDALTVDIADLRARLAASEASAQKLKALNDAHPDGFDIKTLAEAGSNKSQGGGSRWQTIFVTKKLKYTSDSSNTTSDFSMSKWGCNLWIASGGGSNEKSEATAKTSNEGKDLDIEISMKVTLVTVDRSGWFEPQILENSAGFMQNNSTYKFSRYPEGYDKLNPTDMAKKIREELVPPSFPADCPLPCYPSSIILCKDVNIKVSNMSMSEETDKRHFVEKSESSGGFLCFHYNRASEHQEDSSHATFNFAKDGMMVKIPGPQILGYVQQMVPADASVKFDAAKSLASEFYLPPDITPELAHNTDHAGASGAASTDGGRPAGFRAPNPDSNGFKFQIGNTTMTPKADNKASETGNVKPGEQDLTKPTNDGATSRPLAGMKPDTSHVHDGSLNDVFKHIVGQLEDNDATLRDAVKKWLQTPDSATSA